MLSIVLPAYNENTNVDRIYHVLKEVLANEQIIYELIFVNDGSEDNTWEEICKVVKKEKENEESRVKGVNFSQNFGKEGAILAGLAYAVGEACVVMDCDLQHPPETVVEMYRLWQDGYEVVEGVKRSRGKEGALYKFCAKIFYNMMTKTMNIDMEGASDFKLMDRKVVKSILALPERNVFFRGVSSWVGFKKTKVLFDVRERENGESKWSKYALIKYAVKNIVAFSTIPLQFTTIIGGIMFLVTVILGLQTLVRYFMGRAVEGFTTVILLLLFVGSAVMISLGIIGYYIAKIYEETKRRPVYIVSEVITSRKGAQKNEKEIKIY